MAKNTSQSKERKARSEQLARAQKKKERIVFFSALAALLLVIAVVVVIIVITLPKTTNYVCLNVTYTDENGVQHTGDIVIKLDPDQAPITVANFKQLVSEGFYDGLIFHRVIEDFMIQGGGYDASMNERDAESIKGEFSANGVANNIKHVRGTVSMARTSVYDSASSQFFIVHKTSANNTASLDGQYAAFGYVIEGMDIVDAIAALDTDSNDRPLTNVVINSATFVKR